MKRIVMKKDLPIGKGRKLLAGLSVKVPDAEAARLIDAGFAVAFEDHPASQKKAAPKGVKLAKAPKPE